MSLLDDEVLDALDAYRTAYQCPGMSLGNGDVTGCSCGGGCGGACDCPTCAAVAEALG